jgi:hypothetical protein
MDSFGIATREFVRRDRAAYELFEMHTRMAPDMVKRVLLHRRQPQR